MSFEDQFEAFSKFGDTKSDGTSITLSQSDKWMKQAHIFNEAITSTDTAIYFKKLKAPRAGFVEYNRFLADLAAKTKVELDDLKSKMASCGEPAVPMLRKTGKAAATVSRLTDTSRYTGSHKARFDKTGKGKGIAGRKNVVQNEGYVSGYKNKNTYEKPK